jgi:hypothetical protein
MLHTLLLLGATLASTTHAICDRATLKTITDNYLSAQTSGNASLFTAASPSTLYLQDDKPLSLPSGILSRPLKIDFNRSILDTTTCTTFTESIIASTTPQYVIGTRMEIDSLSNRVSKMETLATKRGDWAFNATGYLYWNAQENWDPIPPTQRDKRSVIQAAGDAYFDRFMNINATVPWGTPCARLEGGAYTGARNESINTCDLGLPGNIRVEQRRYVVDETYGVVVLFLYFPGLDRATNRPSPDSHMFRVEKGKIRYIHTLSTCETPGCGMNGTIPMKARRMARERVVRRAVVG